LRPISDEPRRVEPGPPHRPVKLLDLELLEPRPRLTGLDGYRGVRVLARLHGVPVDEVRVAVSGDRVDPADLERALAPLAGLATRTALRTRLERGDGLRGPESLLEPPPPLAPEAGSLVTVAVCTRGRPESLAHTLESLRRQRCRTAELLVVDNAPPDEATRELVAQRFPEARYVREPRPGLGWARNRAVLEASAEVVAFTDDDAVADPGWLEAIAALFARNPDVVAMTGLVLPLELETRAQELFERYGGFGRGARRRWHALRGPIRRLRAGPWGTGANMAFRRKLFGEIGLFDPALGAGQAGGGDDLDIFLRVMLAGHALVYEPSAVVRHRHRRSLDELSAQLRAYGAGHMAFLLRTAGHAPRTRRAVLRALVRWAWDQGVRRNLDLALRPRFLPPRLGLIETRGMLEGASRYREARRRVRAAVQAFGAQEEAPAVASPPQAAPRGARTAVRRVDVAQPLRALDGLEEYGRTLVVVRNGAAVVGEFAIVNRGRPIGPAQLADQLVARFGTALFESAGPGDELAAARDAAAVRCVAEACGLAGAPRAALDPSVSASIVLPTRDRPAQLERCLASLARLETAREVEIVVVDNQPASGLTAPVVERFPGVRLVVEPRAGSACARNTGILAARGAVVVTTDDDVVVEPDWLERLLAPLARADVMAVTGNVRPLGLAHGAERAFERSGGLGKGYEGFEADEDWLLSFGPGAAPTWRLGATANAAFRSGLFEDPRVGLLPEWLGAGTPAGSAEDLYFFYRILSAGHTLVYEPRALVWHEHRRTDRELRAQLYAYSKGHGAHNLTTLLEDGDLRGLYRVLVDVPRGRLRQLAAHAAQSVRGGPRLGLRALLLQVAGDLAAPWALWRSRRRARRLGLRRVAPPACGR
jgi:GT2 family glycosyltransferase